jgi:hypothetical protein
MNIIAKDKKEIRWIGLPKNSMHEVVRLENEKRELLDRINKKKVRLQELILQVWSFFDSFSLSSLLSSFLLSLILLSSFDLACC